MRLKDHAYAKQSHTGYNPNGPDVTTNVFIV